MARIVPGIRGPFARRWITWWGAGLLATYAIAVGVCLATGELEAIYAWFLFLGIPSLILSSGVESLLAWSARRFFSPGQPMGECWFWLATSASCRFLGYLVAHSIGPMLGASQSSQLYMWGLVLGGPLALLCTAFGLNRVAQLLRRHRTASRPEGHDWVVVAILIVMLGLHLWEVRIDVVRHGLPRTSQMLLWLTEPLLLLVVTQSLALRRSAVRMGSGLLVRCWSAMAVAALLVGLGDVQGWAFRTFHLGEALRAFTDPIWVAAGITAALAPAYQVEASSLALTWTPPRKDESL